MNAKLRHTGLKISLAMLLVFPSVMECYAISMTGPRNIKLLKKGVKQDLLEAKNIYLGKVEGPFFTSKLKDPTQVLAANSKYIQITVINVFKGKTGELVLGRKVNCPYSALTHTTSGGDQVLILVSDDLSREGCRRYTNLKEKYVRDAFKEALKEGLKLNPDLSKKEIESLLRGKLAE